MMLVFYADKFFEYNTDVAETVKYKWRIAPIQEQIDEEGCGSFFAALRFD